MESKKINQLATELSPDLSDLTIIGDPTTGISKKITLSQMASLFTGTVEEYANFAAFPLVGVADTIYVAKDTNVIYRWDSTAYVVLSPNIIASLVFNDANGFDGTISLVGSVATLTITTALTTGSVGFIGASGALLQDNANFFWDDTNNRLGLGTNAPTTALDVFGSGIIGRINGTSTNNAYLGFSSAGTNKWSVGNVQSDHRFRIFSEANSAELITILQTGEFGIGIANPTTKFHIDGAASALIANLDANVSVAKSVSFRSDNSNRFNIEVSGTESGSNVGADFFIRRYSDAGSLIDTPLTITRSTGNATFSGILITPQVKAATSAGLSINANSGTQVADFGAGGSANMTLFGGLSGTSATFSSTLAATSASFSSTATATAFIPSGSTVPTNGMYLSAANTLNFATNTTNRLTIASNGAATFSNDVTIGSPTTNATLNISGDNSGGDSFLNFKGDLGQTKGQIQGTKNGSTGGIMYFKTLQSSVLTTAMTIKENFIGINTTPSTLFHAYNSTGTAEFRLERGGAGDVGMRWKKNSADLGYISNADWIIAGASTTDFAINAVNNLILGTAATERLKISNTGLLTYSGGGVASIVLGASANYANISSGGYGATLYMNGATRGGTGGATSSCVVLATDSFFAVSDSSTNNFKFNVAGNGEINVGTYTYNNTTAGAANVYVGGSGILYRSTSSIRFKTQIEDLKIDTSNILSKMRPIWYRSLGNSDRKDWSWYGFIAEELAEIEPRLVHWGYDSTSYETIEIEDLEGNLKQETKLKEDAVLIPDGVQYERITVLLVKELQKMRKELDALKAK